MAGGSKHSRSRGGWVIGAAFDAWALTASMGRYWLAIRPQVKRELRRLRKEVRSMPDGPLRAQANFVLNDESWTLEGAAFFAVLAPRAQRRRVVRLMVTFQAMYNYLDALGEQPVSDPFENGQALAGALLDVFEPRAPTRYYRCLGWEGDDGFLDRLVSVCRENLSALPSTAAVLPAIERTAVRCGVSQAHTHAAIYGGAGKLADWAGRQEEDGYEWWEIAAGAVSSLCMQALFAVAADPRTTAAEADRVEAFYFPRLTGLATLLDSLVDYEYDRSTGNFNTVSHYETNLVAAERLATLARLADGGVRNLRHGSSHAAILSFITAAYLTSPEVDTPYARPIATQVQRSLRPMISLAMPLLRLRRRVGSGLADAGARSSPAATAPS